MSESEQNPVLEVIAEAEMPDALDHAIRKLLCWCFPDDAASFALARAWHESAPAFSVICREAHALLGHVGIVIRRIRCGSVPVTVAGVQNLCVVPERRGTGLSQRLMRRAMREAAQRHVCFGLLFCVPELERFYQSLGWCKTDAPVLMLDEQGRCAAIPQKNIAMFCESGEDCFPAGTIDLMGRDW